MAVVAVASQAAGGHQSEPIQPGPTHPAVTTPHPSPRTHPAAVQDLTAEQIVHSSDAGLYRLLVSPENSDVRASTWAVCQPADCETSVEAVAVTDDGFATTRYVKAHYLTDLQWVGGDTFVVRSTSGRLILVSPSGAIRKVAASATASPLQAGERLVSEYGPRPGRYTFVAVNAQAATSHPIPTPHPENNSLQLLQAGTQSVWGTRDTATIVSSPDGGASWRLPVTPPGHLQLDPIASGNPDDLAVIAAGDDDSRQAGSLHRSTDGGATWQVVHPAALQNLGAAWSVIEPDGSLLIDIINAYGNATTPPGLYESDSGTWQSFHRVDVSGPAGARSDGGDLVATSVNGTGEQSLYLNGRGGVTVSTDEGRTWQVTPVR